MEEQKGDFYVGQTFESRKEFKAFLKQYQETNLVLFTKFKSEYVGKPGPDERETADYDYLKLHCKNYGKPRVNPNLTGERPLIYPPALIKLAVNQGYTYQEIRVYSK